ncbi:putative basic amino acid antiporter YfcC [Aliiglaciecola sp. CAU 1673]|uniref:putative basic amino acid antiporter YfcC n=1 Tax=Aliiglaciecola sp. CAU 1673 TaxID=3032595 RepID=UPI0023DBF19E|nr:putative basic amino acid antiporter YfcC [Aliiglaciecola sp. CAU 1673]MDF2178852.1 putative basic amino acid antiporter YfcC [Aliiglaciecola sp. CAU 1673]
MQTQHGAQAETPAVPEHASSLASRMPDAFVILFIVMVVATMLTHWIPAGAFDTQVLEGSNRTQIVPGSFRLAEESVGAAIFAEEGSQGFFNYAFEGMVSGSKWGSAIGVVAFVLVVGGAFGIIMATGAVNNGVRALIAKSQKLQQLMLPLLFLLFSLGGAIFGMGEEAIAFCILLTPLIIALGYDGITAVLITYIATQIGFATSWMNPFSVAIAQGIAGVPLLSGSGFRMAMWAVFTLAGMLFTLHYSNKVKANPKSSLTYHSDAYFRALHDKGGVTNEARFGALDSLILVELLIGVIWVIWGVTARQYYIPQIASQFFAIGILIALTAIIGRRMSANGASEAFVQGAKDLLPAALIVGMAKGVVLILGGDDASQYSVLNTLLYYAGEAVAGVSEWAAALFMFVFQSVFNFFIASGSGQAALTMPLMAPLSDLVGVSRQTAVLAFQLGDGLTNTIIPTSASLIGCLGVARIDWSVWARFAWRPVVCLMCMAATAMLLAVGLDLQ